MNNWNIYRIKDICEIKSGKRLPKGCDFSSTQTQYPYIRARDIKNGKINTNDLAYISQDVQSKIKRYIVNENDIAITIVASIGDVGFVPKELDGFNLTENAVRLTNFHKNVNSKYLCYYLSQPNLKTYMEGFAVGAAQAKLGIYKIEKLKVQLPPLPTQQKIASILSSYDNLIQNYKKQIEALQTAASELYKEWFVRFRFPGYQTTKFENGIPKGWKVEKLTKLVEVKYGKDHSKLDVGNIPVYGSGGIMRYGNKALYDKETVLIPRKGSLNNIMYANNPLWTVDTMFYTVMLRKNIAKYLYYVLSKIDMESFNAGAALPSMTTEILSHFKIIVPDNEILESFDKKIALIFTQIDNLQQQITNLTQQRDLLLPRLMRGALKVH